MALTLSSNQVATTEKPKCRGCNRVLDNRIPRSAIVKFLLPFISLKRYKCTNCLRTTYRAKF